MTLLKKQLRRETAAVFDGRPVIIEIEPPDWIHFRRKGTRTRWSARAAWLMQKTIEHEVERRRAERIKKRLARRK